MRQLRILFSSAVFLASFLLFLVEPMAAKQLLPIFGGSAAVWITCLVFFQAALLTAYAYAHWLATNPRPIAATAQQALLILAATAAIVYAIHTPSQNQTSDSPVLAIFAALSLSIGLPFLMLGATSPLLQSWLARIGNGQIPYRLYALSNLASLLALALYPTIIEPYFPLKTQRIAWAAAFAVFAILCILLTRKTSTAPALESKPELDLPAAPRIHKILWLLLPMGAAMQLSAVTTYITANIAPIPLLWILPLAVYLITLILAFEYPRLAPRWLITRLLAVMLASLGYMLMQVDVTLPIRIGISFFLAELFLASLFCHSEAYALRPQRPSESTLFYLLFAAGGALGSFLIGIASPLIFRFNLDLALAFFVTATLAALLSFFAWRANWGVRLLWSAATLLMLGFTVLIHTAYERNTPVAVRNFYGALRVRESIGYPAGAVVRVLSNGNIQHGTQIFSPELRTVPTTYYAPDSGIGLALNNCCASRSARNIGVIGLGSGTLAAYAQSGDRFRFYEINPDVIPIAQNIFTYIREAQARGATIEITTGDARTSLTQQLATTGPANYDVLAVDAFSGDAIPLHLLTTEALTLYKQHLAPTGILAFHISNQHVDLEPEVAQLAQAAGMQAVVVNSPINEERGEFSATWMLVTNSADFLAQPQIASYSRKPIPNPRVHPWTDDYSSLLPILRW